MTDLSVHLLLHIWASLLYILTLKLVSTEMLIGSNLVYFLLTANLVLCIVGKSGGNGNKFCFGKNVFKRVGLKIQNLNVLN